MRRETVRAIQIVLVVGLSLVVLLPPSPSPMRAGGPLRVGGPSPSPFGPDGAFLVFPTMPISYTVDGGPLSALVNNADGITLVNALFGAWQAVPTSSIAFNNAGTIPVVPGCFADGNVDTVAEFSCLGTQGNPIIFDADGTIHDALFGPGSSVLGFAGPALTGPPGMLSSARAVLNGRFRDGNAANGEVNANEFEAVFLHEFGHYFGLEHSQINLNCLSNPASCPSFSDDTFGLPTMFPTLLSGREETAGVHPARTLSDDDIAWVSRLYPDPSFSASHGFITGTVFFSDGATHLQGINVIARRVDDPGTATVNESRRNAVSVVSGYLFTGNFGVGSLTDAGGAAVNSGSPFGSRVPGNIGFYSVPVPAGFTYNVEVEGVNSTFVLGSSVGPLGQGPPAGMGEIIPVPGTAPSPISVGPVGGGATLSGNNFTFTGTPPPNDSFDAVALNETPATGTPITNGTTSASLSPFRSTVPDIDVYAFTALPATTVNLEIFARRLTPTMSFVDSMLEIVDSGGTRQNTCRATAGTGPFTAPCFHDDITPGTNRDSILEFQSGPGGTFFVIVRDFFGNARPDLPYNLVVSGAGPAPAGTADIVVTKTDSADPVNVGQQFTYTVTVVNQGPNAATAVTVNDTLTGPANTIGTITPSQGTCGAPVGGAFTCNLGTVNVGTPVTITVQVTPNAAGTLTNTVSATTTATDPTPANNTNIVQTTTVVTTPAPGVGFAPTSVAFGNQNVGSTSANTTVTLTNTGSATLNVTSITEGGTDATQFNLLLGGAFTCPAAGNPTLAPGANCTFGVNFAPTSAGPKSANIAVASNAAGSPHTVPLTGTGVAGTDNARLNGRYAFAVREVGDPPTTAGSFVADGNGIITSGVIDFNRGEGTGVVLQNEPFTGTYAVGADGRGTMTLNATNPALGSVPLRFALVGNDKGYIQAFDPTDPVVINRGGDGGVFEKQDSTAFSLSSLSASGGNFAFQSRGNMTVVTLGRFTVNAAGAISGGVLDINNSGTPAPNLSFTGTVGAPNATTGRGIATLNITSPPVEVPATLNLRYYVVRADKLFFVNVDVDPVPALVGTAEKQSGTLSNASVSGTYIFFTAASDNTESAGIGRFTANGAGVISGGLQDRTDVGAVSENAAFTGTYSIASNGRGTGTITDTASSTTDNVLFYLISNARAFVMDTDAFDGNTGEVFLQTGGPFSNSSLSGTYGFGLEGTNVLAPTGSPDHRRTGVFMPSAGNVDFAQDISDGGNLSADVTSSGTYTVDAAGRGTFTVGSNSDLRFYMVSPSKLLLLNLNFNLSLFGTAEQPPPVAPAVTLNPTSLAFGNQLLGTTSSTTNIQVSNTGTATLNISGITKTGADPTQFNLVAPTGGASPACSLVGATAVPAATSCFFGVNFAPTTTGAKSANVSVASDAAGSPNTVPLTGTGVAPAVTLNPTSLAFGNQLVSTTSATQNIQVSNTGTATLNISGITKTGTDPTQFNLVAPTGGASPACSLAGATAVPAGASCFFGVNFAPTTTGAKSANASIASDASGSPHTVPLTGTGVAPAVGLVPTNIAFGNQPVGTTSGTTNIQVSNTGTATLNISGITKTGTDPTQFNLVAPTGGASPACSLVGATAVPAAASCFFGVNFAPTTTGAKSANASIASDASGSPHTVPLTGNGIAATVALTPNPVAFGDQRVGTTSAAQTVTVTNNGTASANITGITLTGADAAHFNLVAPGSGTPCPLGASSLAPSSNCTLGVNFAPTTTGAKSANVSVASDASGSPHTTLLTGNGTQSQATPNPASVDFGDQVITTTSAPRTITVTNGGTATLNIATVVLGGADAAHFAIAAGTTCTNASTVAPGANCVINMTFTPATTGAKNATITLTDDAPDSPQSIPLTGNGVPPPAVSLNPTSLSFGNQRVGTTSAAQGVTVTNTGGSNLVFSSISITGANAGDFAIAAGTTCSTSSPVAPTASCLINATFVPTGLGARAGDISIASNATGSPHTVPMTGTGTQPAVTLNPTNVAFGNQFVGTTSAAQNIQVTNSGTDTLNISGITKTGTDPTQFNLVAPTGGASPACSLVGATAVPAGASCFFGVNFAPTSTGAKSANASIASDAPGSPHTVPLTGTGIQAAVTLNPTSVTFPPQAVGTTSATQNIQVSNTGTATFLIIDISKTGTDPTQFNLVAPTGGASPACSLGREPTQVSAGASCFFGVDFAPTTTGAKSASIRITDDAPGSPHTVPLSGSTPPEVTLNPTSLVFGSQAVGGTSATQNFTVTNSGGSNLNITGITLTGANAADFALVAPTSGTACPTGASTLAAGASCGVGVQFRPGASSTGARTANASVASNAPGSPHSVALTGTGVDFSVASPTAAQTVTAGGTANYTIDVAPLGGSFGSAVTLGCASTSLPRGTACTFTPNPVTPAGSTVSSALAISTTAKPAGTALPPSGGGFRQPPVWPLLAALAMLFMALLGMRAQEARRPSAAGVALVVILVLAGAYVTGCNGGFLSDNQSTPPGNYTITVTGASGSLTHSTTVTLNVQ